MNQDLTELVSGEPENLILGHDCFKVLKGVIIFEVGEEKRLEVILNEFENKVAL